MWGIYSIGDASTFSEIGKRISLRFGLFLILMTAACALPSILSLSAILDFAVTAVIVFSGQCVLAIAARDFKE